MAQHGSVQAKTAEHEAQEAPRPAHHNHPAVQPLAAPNPAPTSTTGASPTPPDFANGLTVGRPHDRYEREADQMGEQVSRMPVSGFSGLLFSAAPAPLQRHEDEEADVQAKLLATAPTLQRKPDGGLHTTSQFTRQVQASAGGGQALPAPVQQSMGSAFQADFSGVRIHTDTQAAQLSTDIGAKAFTYGRDIYFNDNQYDTASAGGRFLLAHELTHTVQQGAAVRRAVQPGGGAPAVQAFSFSVLDEAIDELLKYLNPDAIPGYSLLSVIISYDVFRRRTVAMTAENLVKGLLELVPVFGLLLFDLLQKHQVIGRAFAWVKGELGRLRLTQDRLKNTLQAAWEELHLADGIAANLEVLKRHFLALKNDVVSFVESIKNQLLTMLKEALVGVLKGLALDKIPAYALFTKVVGHDPITGQDVAAPLEEILADFLDLMGKKQEREEMDKRGTLKKTADWLRSKLAQFLGLLGQVRTLVAHLWDAFSFESLRDPVGTLTGLVNEAKAVVLNVWNFAKEVALTVLRFIKDALLGLLKAHANQLPGYHLLTVILEKDPVTNQPVERNAVNLIGGFIDLVAGPEKFAEIKQSGAIERMVAWLEGAIAKFQITWEGIKKLFTDIWNSLTINDLINPIGAFVRVVGQFREPIARLVAFVVEVVKKVIYTVLELMNFPFDLINQIVAKAMQAYDDIKRDPMAFLGNLLKAVKLGFSQFFGHIGTHLLNGLVGWLTSELKKANIKPPKDFTFRSILAFVLDVLGISMEKVWKILADHPKIGPQKVAKIRGMIDKLTGIWTFVKEVMEEGPGAIWRHIQEKLTNLWDTVLDKVKAWILAQIVDKMVAKLLSMLDPTGIMAIINSFIAFYRAVQSFIERLREILEVVSSFVGGVAEIARGVVTTGANFLERTMANALPTVIGFLANQVGLRNLGGRISEMIQSAQDMVYAGMTWLVNKAVDMGTNLLNSLFSSKEEDDKRTPQQKEDDLKKGVAEGEVLLKDEHKTKPQIKTALDLIKNKYKLKKLELVKDSEDQHVETDHIAGEVNPKLDSKPTKRPKLSDNLLPKPALKSGDLIKVHTGSWTVGKFKNYKTQKINNQDTELIEIDVTKNKNSFISLKPIALFNADLGWKLYSPAGSINYGGLDNSKRPTGVRAILDLKLPPGTVASYTPVGFPTTGEYQRGHLLGKQLGGSGSEPANIAPLLSKVNSPLMSGYEGQIRQAVENGQIVTYFITPVYQGQSQIPRAVMLEATGDGGFTLNVSILNQ